MYLPDVNLWLALAFERHVHHSAAKKWFDAALDASCAFCRLTQQGFLRIATNPKAFGDEAVTMEGAWQLYDEFCSDTRVAFLAEPAGLETQWRIYTGRQTFSNKVWSDAYLAAFAQAAMAELVTFDGGFSQYRDSQTVILSGPDPKPRKD